MPCGLVYEKIALDASDERVYLEVYAPDKISGFTRDALLVIPGGGYTCVYAAREGEPIALDFIQKGCCAFVLHYSVNEGARFPKPLIEASRAMKYIRDHAERYGINKNRVFVTGFSAGGHLCTALGVLWHEKAIYDACPMEFGENRPTGIIPVYPVISAMVPTHQWSFFTLLGTEKPTEEEKARYSLERCVDERSAPACIIHTSDDQVVPVYNALALAKAYADANRSFELHVYKSAPHGMALASEITAADNDGWNNPHNVGWTALARDWMKGIEESCE